MDSQNNAAATSVQSVFRPATRPPATFECVDCGESFDCPGGIAAADPDHPQCDYCICKMLDAIDAPPMSPEKINRMVRKITGKPMDDLKVGDDVEVLDAGLAMLRQVAPGMPPNHHGRIEAIDGDTITVEFPIDGSYDGHSQSAPYPRSEVRKR